MKLLAPKKLLSLLLCTVLTLSMLVCSGTTVLAIESNDTQKALTVPQIRVVTKDGNGVELEKEDGYVDATISITDTDGSVLNSKVSFKVRGNTTSLSWILKKPFTFKFSDKTSVLGMSKAKKWALVANAFDPTLLRNFITFNIAKELDITYTSNQKYVELWVDDSYRGCYTLYEPVQEGKNRVNIDIESNGGKKDFLIEYEASRVEDDVTYFTVDGKRFIASEPEEPTEEQLSYITDTMTDIINTMKSGDREAISEKIDIESFAKFYLLNDFVKTYDFDMSSVYFYYKDNVLYAGPPWDYDLSAGNVSSNFARGRAAEGTDGLFATKNLFSYLCQYDWFYDEVIKQYDMHEAFFDNIYADGGLMDSLREQYGAVFDRNFDTANGGWNIRKWWINISKQPLLTYQANYDFLKNWYKERNEWLKAYYDEHTNKIVFGDADGNGNVNIEDVTHMQKLLAELIEDDGSLTERCDIDGNGFISIMDVTALQRDIAQFENNYGIGTIIKHYFSS